MKSSAYTAIGLFVLVAFALAAIGAVLIGGRRTRSSEALFETYVEETVQGIGEGSAVKYRGIPVGAVRTVEFAMLRYGADAPDSPDMRRARRYARIVFAIDAARFGDPARLDEAIRAQIRDGLHVHAKSQGITGLSYLDLDFDEGGIKELPVPWEPEHTYIPVAPSLAKTLTDVVQNLAQELHGLSETKAAIDAFLAEATALAAALRADGVSALADAGRLAATLREGAEPLLQSASETLSLVRCAIDGISGPLAETSENLSRATGEFSGLAEALRADPSRILRKPQRDTLP